MQGSLFPFAYIIAGDDASGAVLLPGLPPIARFVKNF